MDRLSKGDLDDPAQPVGTGEKPCDIPGCLLGRIVPRCLKTHRRQA